MIKKFRLGLVATLGLLVLAACGQPVDPTVKHLMTVNVTDGGSVTSDPIGIDTGSGQFTAEFDEGTEVTLTATPATGYFFTGWTGDCAGNDCVITMDADAEVTASFAEVVDDVVLTVNVVMGGASAGSVTSSPAGIDTAGGDTDSAPFPSGTEVTLTATADTGAFAGWTGGDCAGVVTATCTLTITEGVEAVTANFNDVTTITASAATETTEELMNEGSSSDYPPGHTFMDSSDLDFSYDSSNGTLQHFAMRFDMASLPEGAVIVSAAITFTASATHSDPVVVTLYADSSAAPSPLGNDADGAASHDLTSRTATTANVAWDMEAFTAGDAYDSPDLSAVLQEVVNLDGFLGSAVFIVEPDEAGGTNQRAAHSAFGGNPANPMANPNSLRPTITVEYVVLPPI